MVFSNRIAYFTGQSNNPVEVENEFYVTEITNLPEKEMLEHRHEEFCDEKSPVTSSFFKEVSPDKFYIRYDKNSGDGMEH